MVTLCRQYQKAAICARILKRNSHQPLNELGEDNLAGHRLRGLDDARHIELLDRLANGRSGRMSFRSSQLRIKPVELFDFAVGAPAEITIPSVPETGVGKCLDTARTVEPGG